MPKNTWTINDYCPECEVRTLHLVVKQKSNGYHVQNVRSCDVCGCKRKLYTPQSQFKKFVIYVALAAFAALLWASCTPQREVLHSTTMYDHYMKNTHPSDTVVNPFPGDASGAPDLN